MKAHSKFFSIFGLTLLFVFGFATNRSNAVVLEGALHYPVAIGSLGQSFNPNLGFNGALYLDPILDESVNNFISVSYSSFTVRADGRSSYRVIPVLFGLELPGKVTNNLKTVFAGALGGSVAYMNVTNPQGIINVNAYFTAQLSGGFDYDLGSNLSFYARTPITFVLSSNALSYVSYSLGLGIKL